MLRYFHIFIVAYPFLSSTLSKVINEEVSKKQADCERDLAKAEPALLAAQAALDTLNKNNLTELKSFGSPPAAVVNVTAAVMVLLSNKAGRSLTIWKCLIRRIRSILILLHSVSVANFGLTKI